MQGVAVWNILYFNSGFILAHVVIVSSNVIVNNRGFYFFHDREPLTREIGYPIPTFPTENKVTLL